jgi:hypothetical protein
MKIIHGGIDFAKMPSLFFLFFSLGKMSLYPLKNTLNIIVVEQCGEKIL